MAFKVSSSLPSDSSVSLISSFSPQDNEGITALIDSVYQGIEKYFAMMAGVPLAAARDITHLSGKLSSGSYPKEMRPSLFDEKMLPSLSQEQKCHLLYLLKNHAFFSEVPLFTGLSIHLFLCFKGLAKENVHLPMRETAESFLQLFFGLLMHIDTKKDVEKRIFSLDPAASACLQALKSPNLSVSPSFFIEIMDSMMPLLQKTKTTPLKKESILNFQLLQFFVSSKGIDELFYFTELKSFKEAEKEASSLDDLYPLISVFRQINDILHYSVAKNDYLPLHQKPFELFDNLIRDLRKEDVDEKQRSKLVKKIYKTYLDHCLVTAPQLNYMLQYKHKQLIREPFDPIQIANAYSLDSSFKQCIYLVEKIGRTLGAKHECKFYHLLSRLGAMLIYFYGSSCVELNYAFTPPFADLNDIMKTASLLSVFNFSNEQYDLLMKDYLELYDLEHMIPDMKKRFKDAFDCVSEPSVQSVLEEMYLQEEREIDSYAKSMKGYSFIPSILCFYHMKLFKFANVENVDKKLEQICASTQEIVQVLPKELKTEELQEAIRFSFADSLSQLVMEFLLYRDLVSIFSTEELDDETFFPSSLLNLIFFEIPGLTEEESTSLPKEAFDDLALNTSSSLDDEIEAIAPSSMQHQVEEVLPFPQPAIACARKVKKIVSKQISANSSSKEHIATTPTKQDFLRAKKHRQIKKLLKMFNCSLLRTRGSHESYGTQDSFLTVLPHHTKDLKIGTRSAIWKQLHGGD